jgi:hypothetical protein
VLPRNSHQEMQRVKALSHLERAIAAKLMVKVVDARSLRDLNAHVLEVNQTETLQLDQRAGPLKDPSPKPRTCPRVASQHGRVSSNQTSRQSLLRSRLN